MDALEYLIVTYINYHQFLFYMYAVIVFALALLSPLPFVSPYSIVQDATAQNTPRCTIMDYARRHGIADIYGSCIIIFCINGDSTGFGDKMRSIRIIQYMELPISMFLLF